jgi:hypothetical protein
MVGVSHTIHRHIDNQHHWSAQELDEWNTEEEEALNAALATNYDSAINSESKEWWLASTAISRTARTARSKVFPHMSQRAMWSRAALDAATGMMLEGEDGTASGSVVELARDHILEDPLYACKQHIQDLETQQE